MSRITIAGIIAIVLGGIAYFVNCPYGVHIMIAGAVLAVIGYFLQRPHHPAT